MGSTRPLLALILSLGLLLSTCSQKNLVEITQTSFQEAIPTQENLTFTFNRSLVPDSLLNVWDTTSYIQFEPKVAGKYKWISPYELVFSPVKGFQPSTDYEAKPNPQWVSQTKDGLSVGEASAVKFHTYYLKLEDTDIFWSQDDRRTNQLRVNLNFNYKVFPLSMQELVSLSAGGESIPAVRVLNHEPSEVVELVIEEVGSLDLGDKLLEFSIAPGVKCAESDYTTLKAIEFKAESPNKNRLVIKEVIPEFEEFRGHIRVKTNQSVNLVQILNNLDIQPKMVYEVQLLEDGFLVKGNFQPGGDYTLKINNELRGIFGATMREDFTREISFGEIKPSISFAPQGAKYLSSKGQKNVGIRIHNVPQVELKVYKIYENNLIHFIRQHRDLYDNMNAYRRRFQDYGDLILERTYDTKTLPLVSDFRVLNLNLDQINSDKGVYAVQVNSNEEQWLNSNRLISISDIGLIVKETQEDYLVFANSLMNAQAMGGVNVNLVSQSNQVISSARTDNNGVAVLAGVKKKYPDARVELITAQTNQDFNYLYPEYSPVNTRNFDTGGISLSASGYQAFLYGERDLYRPGEQVNLNVILRDRQWKTVGKIPIKVKFKLPNGRDLTQFRATLNEQGAYAISIDLPPSAITGTYYAEVYSATDQLLTSMPVSVEEFMPDRIRVGINLMDADYKSPFKGSYDAGDSVRAKIKAVNLFGPPAANKNYQTTFTLRKKSFQPEAFTDYNFDLEQASTRNYSYGQVLDTKNSEGSTNQDGLAYEGFLIPKEYENLGLLQGEVLATVFDETGRSVSRRTDFDIFTQNALLGIQEVDDYISTNRNLSVGLLALNRQETPISSEALLQVIRYKWQTVLEKSYNGELQYVSKKQEEILEEKTVQISGTNTAFSYIPRLSGHYEIRLSLPDAENHVSRRFYAYGYAYTDNTAFQIDRDGKIKIETDKDTYQVGEQAKLLFTAPFDGKMLVTVERDQVLKHFYLNTQNKTATTTLDIQGVHLPNTYISATLIKPLSDGAIPLTVAHGFHPIQVEDPQSKLELSIEAVEKTESKQKQTIKVRTNRPQADVQVTIAVVDEGILQLKNFQTPDPHAYFFQKRSLEVEAYDIYPQLFPEISLSKSSTGGGADMSLRVNPVVNQRVKLVRFWSGILATNAAGEVDYTIDIPSFSGSLRIMAVAFKNGAFGSAQKSMTVADPVVISTGLPRFLSPKDRVKIPVTVFNTTDQDLTAQVKLKTTDNLKILGDAQENIKLKAQGENQAHFEIRAEDVIDQAQLEVNLTALGRTFTEKLDITIRPVVGLVKRAGAGSITGGQQAQISLENNLVPSTTQASLMISKSPMIQFANSLDYLVTYPYGCVEQVTSSVFPQLYAQALMKAISPDLQNVDLYEAEIQNNVKTGILRLLSMQNYSGGLGYWPGSYEASWFGTAYASHFMIEAQKTGYYVPNSALERMLGYLKDQVVQKNTHTYYYYKELAGNRRRYKRQIAPKEAIYSLYILALAKKPDVSTMNYYKENQKLLALDSKYLLATSYLLLGDKTTYQALLPQSFSGEYAEQALSGSFYSYIRDEALALNALLEGDENNLQVPTMAKHLSEQLKQKRSLNTQERAFALLALGKLSKRTSQSQIQAQVLAGGNTYASFVSEDLILEKDLAGKQLRIATQGSGNLYYFWEMSGLSLKGEVKEEDRQLKVRKTFYDRDGKVIRDYTFRQNDLVVVKLSVVSEPYFGDLENVVITDMLPAGLEIENPRLTRSSYLPWLEAKDRPDYFDIRDDRIHLFTTVKGKPQAFYYLARAVTQGEFQMGPVSAEAMYNGQYYSYHGAGTFKIAPRLPSGN